MIVMTFYSKSAYNLAYNCTLAVDVFLRDTAL